MFEYKKVFVKKEIIREYDKDGKLVRERTILDDGGLGQEEAEKRLKGAWARKKAFEHMDKAFEEMDKAFKSIFK